MVYKAPTFWASTSIKFIFSPSPFELGVKALHFNIFSKISAIILFVILSSNKESLKSNWWLSKERINLNIKKETTDSIIFNLKFIIYYFNNDELK